MNVACAVTWRGVVWVLAVLPLAACVQLLPQERMEDRSSFGSYEAAQRALSQVTPYKTTVADLKALGFDVYTASNVVHIPYPELITRLVPHPNLPLDAMDPGIRDCIAAREGCVAYALRIERQSRQRAGGFWLDFLNFRRITAVKGWRFEGLLAIRDGVVVFRSSGGEPSVDRTERQSNPLGPLQSAGEGSARLLSR
jgi:hypothetical protein